MKFLQIVAAVYGSARIDQPARTDVASEQLHCFNHLAPLLIRTGTRR
jgi:hypothetical protein